MHKSSVDLNSYFSFSLPNGLKVIAISDPKADKGGCALSVRVGSYDEPRSLQGLAHFLEHMLFMGTEDYPRENEYMDFLSQHNGSSNAYTANENTVYYFDVSLSHFEKALKIFSSFFKTPLFLKESVDREISAVHSEFLNGKCSDSWRIFRMYQLCCKEDLPESQFNVGNNQTLRIENIHEIVKKFWKKKYSADKMCLVLYSNVDEETFRGYCKYFDEIPKDSDSTLDNRTSNNAFYKDNAVYKEDKSISANNDNATLNNSLSSHCSSLLESLSLSTNLFKKELTNRLIHVEPIKDQKTLIISVVVPSEYRFLDINPYAYIEFLFCKENGLVGCIKNEGLGFYADFDLESYFKYSLLQITIGLTKKGENQIEKLLKLIESFFSNFEYSENEYNRIRDLKELQFHYKEMDDPIDCVESMAEIMQYVPMENVLDYAYNLKKWDQKVLEYVVSCIGDRSKWLIFYCKKDLEFDREDELYGIKYKVNV